MTLARAVFAKLTQRRLQRSVFHSLVELQAAIDRYVALDDTDSRPFVWTTETMDRVFVSSEGAGRRSRVSR